MQNYWQKQGSEPLYPDLLWSRPENRSQAGKLLIIGGNVHGFAAVGEAYGAAEVAGAGNIRVLLPDSLQKTVGRVFAGGEFAPSTKSGSFAQAALDGCLALANWADGVLLAGDLGRNSETAILLEKFISKYSDQLTVTQDALDYFTKSAEQILARPETSLVLSFAQLQKLAASAKFPKPFLFEMNLVNFVERLHEFTEQFKTIIVVKHHDTVFVAHQGRVSSTAQPDQPVWRVKTAAKAAIWWLQNPTKPLEAITTSII